MKLDIQDMIDVEHELNVGNGLLKRRRHDEYVKFRDI